MYKKILKSKKSIFCILFFLFYCNITCQSLVEYLRKFAPIAVYEMKHFGIPASIKLSQSILESYYGNSMLATESNNHFGIKCGKYWAGDFIEHDDDEIGEYFRKYESPWHSFRDHSKFLKKPRYAKLFFLCINNYKGWAKGLQYAGYATAKDYAERIISNIEKYQLWRFDDLDYKDLNSIYFTNFIK